MPCLPVFAWLPKPTATTWLRGVPRLESKAAKPPPSAAAPTVTGPFAKPFSSVWDFVHAVPSPDVRNRTLWAVPVPAENAPNSLPDGFSKSVPERAFTASETITGFPADAAPMRRTPRKRDVPEVTSFSRKSPLGPLASFGLSPGNVVAELAVHVVGSVTGPMFFQRRT